MTPENTSPESHGTVAYNVSLSTPDGDIHGQVQVSTGPMHLAEIVPTAYELTMVLSGRANKREEKVGRPISCKAGCGACCRQLVPVSPPEAFYIYDIMSTFEPGQRTALGKRFDEIVRLLENENMIAELLHPTVTDEPVLDVGLRYFGMQQACPFLVNESCGIHPFRPVACREYNVTSPAERCAEPYANEIAKVPMPMPFSLPLARMTGELVGFKPPLIPLTLVPYWVERNLELGRRTWPGPELFRCFMSHLAKLPSRPKPES